LADSGLTPAAGESTPIAKEINAPVQRELTPGTKGELQNLQNIFTTQILDRSYTTALLVWLLVWDQPTRRWHATAPFISALRGLLLACIATEPLCLTKPTAFSSRPCSHCLSQPQIGCAMHESGAAQSSWLHGKGHCLTTFTLWQGGCGLARESTPDGGLILILS